VCEREFRGLVGHRPADFGNAVANVNHGRLARRIEKFASIR
jgi:hypothetical protein